MQSQAFNQAIDILKTEIPFALWETLYATILSTFFAFLIGLPIGVLLITPLPKPFTYFINSAINILRSIPFLILMIVVFPLTRLIVGTTIGTAASIVPLVIAAFPFVARLVESSLREVDPNIIEMAKSNGASQMQIVTKVLIPESMPSLISNATIALTTVLSYTAMSGIIGGGGLGKIAINYGYYRYQNIVMFFSVVILVLLVQMFQMIGSYIANKKDKRKL